MSIICKNGAQHTHESVYESKVCWGVISPPAAPSSGYVSAPVSRPEPATRKQIEYVGDLGGDKLKAAAMTKESCSGYIKELLATKGATPKVYRQERTKRQEFILGLLPSIPDGYFAVSPSGDDSDVKFLRVKRPTHGRLKGCSKVQTQHSDELDDKLIYYPNTDRLWLKPGHGDSTEESIMFLFADYQGAAMRYARLIGKCCRCNKALTDARSRWYGIGPDCEEFWPWMIEAVSESKGHFRG